MTCASTESAVLLTLCLVVFIPACSDDSAGGSTTHTGSGGSGAASSGGSGGQGGSGAAGGACAAPRIDDVTGSFDHGASVTLSGCGFGTKDPAPPLMWDDCEGLAVDDQAAVLGKGWVDPWPRSGSVVSHHIQYRTIPYRDTPAPHSLSTQYLAGGHYQQPDNDPPYIGTGSEDYRNVTVTADAGEGRPRWFAIWYYRLDPLWRDVCPPSNNHKTSTVQSGGGAYMGAFSYVGYRSQAPCGVEFPQFGGINNANCDNGSWPDDFPPTHNPRLQWVHYEDRMADDDVLGFRHIIIDNQWAVWSHENCTNWFSSQGGEYATGIRSYSAGGYYRWATDINDTSTYRGDENAFRYFDDLYVDTTLARVMLADHADYEQATIVEPQIPSAWSDGAIAVTVNRGRLADADRAYLFVFDADDVPSSPGVEVTLP